VCAEADTRWHCDQRHGILAGMAKERYSVTCRWDDEAHVWYVSESNVPGLSTEADTVEQMEQKLRVMVPELLQLNEPSFTRRQIPFELIARKSELSLLSE